jgi:hypothetical protein
VKPAARAKNRDVAKKIEALLGNLQRLFRESK